MTTIHLKEINTFFAYIGKNLSSHALNKQYLWKALEICKWNANNKSIELLDSQFFHETLSSSNLIFVINNASNPIIVTFAKSLLDEMGQDPIVATLPIYIQENLAHYNEEIKTDKFGTAQIGTMLNYTILTAIAVSIYYAFALFGWKALVGILGFGAYWLIVKAFKKLSNKNKENKVIHILKKNIKENKKLIQQTDVNNELINLGIWELNGLSEELKKSLHNLRNQMLLFSQIYPQKKDTSNLYMEEDILKMNNSHIPLFIQKVKDNMYNEQVVDNTIITMTNLVQNHISKLLWSEQLDLSAQNRYWLKKASESDSFEHILEKNA